MNTIRLFKKNCRFIKNFSIFLRFVKYLWLKIYVMPGIERRTRKDEEIESKVIPVIAVGVKLLSWKNDSND